MEDRKNIESRIVYIQNECIVINKYSGEAIQGTKNDLAKILTEQIGGDFFPTHRLDIPVSGLSLFARTPKALAFLNSAFAERRIEKKYWAIVEKTSISMDIPETGNVIHWIKTDKKQNKSIAYTENIPNSKKAHLYYCVKGLGDNYIFMEISLISGRHHQIRAQLASLGLHIKGDLKYGAKRSEKNGGIRLHSYSLLFPNPIRQNENIYASALPPFYDNLWETFGNV